jgi:hypothetical protein
MKFVTKDALGSTARSILGEHPPGGTGSMALNTSLPRSAHSKILARLRTLRANITQARHTLIHFKEDRVDRDKLEPAARRVDDLINMFASNARDPVQGSLWITEIQTQIKEVTNSKAAGALREAQAEITALLDVMQTGEKGPSGGPK